MDVNLKFREGERMKITYKELAKDIIKSSVSFLVDLMLLLAATAIVCWTIDLTFSWKIPFCLLLMYYAISAIIQSDIRRYHNG